VNQLEEAMGISCDPIQMGVYSRKWIACCSHDDCTCLLTIFVLSLIISFSRILRCKERHALKLLTILLQKGYGVVIHHTNRNWMTVHQQQKPNKRHKTTPIPRAYTVNMSHALYLHLRHSYNMNAVCRVKKRLHIDNEESEEEWGITRCIEFVAIILISYCYQVYL
jgi:hypothetical protein